MNTDLEGKVALSYELCFLVGILSQPYTLGIYQQTVREHFQAELNTVTSLDT